MNYTIEQAAEKLGLTVAQIQTEIDHMSPWEQGAYLYEDLATEQTYIKPSGIGYLYDKKTR